ncbi:MAG: oligosaccharide flippase family protein [Bacillus sp. (in: firmicutes)]
MWNIKNKDLSGKFLKGAFILTFSSIFIKLLSAIYRIPYQNIVGDIGFYVYQQVYPFYSFILVVGTYGFPVVVSKLLAEADTEGYQYTKTEVLTVASVTLSVAGLAGFVFLNRSAERIAEFMGDPMLAGSLKLISYSLLLVPVASVLKGLLQSEGNMVPTAAAQIVEQSMRVGIILLSCYLFYSSGIGVYKVAEGAYMGSVVGAVAGVIVLAIYWLRGKRQEPAWFDSVRVWRNYWPLTGKILGQGLLFALSSLILVFMQFLDALMLYPLLVDSGMQPTDAKQLKGIYDRGQPLIQLGTAAILALSLTLVPFISKFNKEKKRTMVMHYSELSLRLSLMLSMPAAVGLFWIIVPVNAALFTDTSGSSALRVLSLTILFGSIVITGIYVLQSMNCSATSIGIIAAGLLCKFILMIWLVPAYSIMGAAIATTSSFFLMALLLALSLRVIFKQAVLKSETVHLMALSTAVMSVFLAAERTLVLMNGNPMETGRLFAVVEVLLCVGIGAALYMYLVIRKGLFSREELRLLPLGSKLEKILPKSKQV